MIKFFFYFFPISVILSLFFGFFPLGSWHFDGFISLLMSLWFVFFIWPRTTLATIILIISIGLSILGFWLGASPVWMVLSGTLSIGGWNFSHLYLDVNNSTEKNLLHLLEKRNIVVICILISSALLLQLTGRMVQFPFPFWVLLILITVFVFCMDRVWRFLNN